MKLKIFIAALCALGFVAQAKAGGAQDKAIAALVAQYQGMLTASFKDPDSAKFRNLKGFAIDGVDPAKAITLCGEVNAKNSYGAYVGFEAFVSTAGFPIIGEDPRVMTEMVAKSCTGKVIFDKP